MAKRRGFDGDKMNRWLEQGRGQGEGPDYKPWLTIRDVPSCGLRTRILGVVVPRIYHLMSQIELWLFQHTEFRQDVIDIREQYPLLPQQDTLAIARQLAVPHPRDPYTRFPIVITTDLLVTVRRANTISYEAWCVKPSRSLQVPRVLDKLEIERRFWTQRGVPWFLFTDDDFSPGYRSNLKVFHPYLRPNVLHPLKSQDVQRITKLLIPEVHPGTILAHTTTAIDTQLQLPLGTALHVARYLIAHRAWPLHWSVAFDPRRPLVFRSSHSASPLEWSHHAIPLEHRH